MFFFENKMGVEIKYFHYGLRSKNESYQLVPTPPYLGTALLLPDLMLYRRFNRRPLFRDRNSEYESVSGPEAVISFNGLLKLLGNVQPAVLNLDSSIINLLVRKEFGSLSPDLIDLLKV